MVEAEGVAVVQAAVAPVQLARRLADPARKALDQVARVVMARELVGAVAAAAEVVRGAPPVTEKARLRKAVNPPTPQMNIRARTGTPSTS